MLRGLIKWIYVVTLQHIYIPVEIPNFLHNFLSTANNSSLFTGAILIEKFVFYFYSSFCSFYDTNSFPQSTWTGITDFMKLTNLCPYFKSVNLKSTPSAKVSIPEQKICALCLMISCSKNNIFLLSSLGMHCCLTWTLQVYKWGVKLFLQSSHCTLCLSKRMDISLSIKILLSTSFCIFSLILYSLPEMSV